MQVGLARAGPIIKMAESWKPTETKDCCAIWPQIVARFNWMRFEEAPEFSTMPVILIEGHSYRVNYCPSCGAKVRDVVILRERVMQAAEKDLLIETILNLNGEA